MKWKISWLKSLTNQEHEVNEVLKFDQKMFARVSNINGVSDIKVTGTIKMEGELVKADLTFTGILYLPCANTNEIGDYSFEFKIDDLLDEEFVDAVNYDADYIDLLELTWQRLIVEAPTRFVKNKNTNKTGKSWQLLSEEEYLKTKEDEIDPRFAKLKDLFKDDKED